MHSAETHAPAPPDVPREGTPRPPGAQHGCVEPRGALASLRRALAGAGFRQFLRFLSVGAVSTLADWSVFYVCSVRMKLHYQVGVSLSWTLATVVHYALNKVFTFRCTSPRILRQLALHACTSAVYLLLSMGSMYALVELAHFPAMPSKILTTGVMMLVSFTLTRLVTFNPEFLS